MAFYGSSFVFDGKPSETFNLFISSPDGGEVQTSGSSNVQLITQEIFRRPKPYLLGVKQSPVLSFPISLNSPDEINALDMQYIQKWLFGHSTYKKLFIVQPDMQDVYFNCFLLEPQIQRVGNIMYGVSATVTCDSPFAWTFERKLSYTYSADYTITNFLFNNVSDDNHYCYPKVEIAMNDSGGDVSLINDSDDGRSFTFTELQGGEQLTVDNDMNMIVSSTGLRRLPNFNKKWFRFVPGVNRISVFGGLASLNITYQFAKKIGG